jgi:hypothetical protein
VRTTENLSHDEPSVQRRLIDRLPFTPASLASMTSLVAAGEAVTADGSLGAFVTFRMTGAVPPLAASRGGGPRASSASRCCQ